MRVAFGADATGVLTDALVGELEKRGIAVARYGALADGSDAWASIGGAVGHAVAGGGADYGVVCCWTGTGISIAANNVGGVPCRAVFRRGNRSRRQALERRQRAGVEHARDDGGDRT